MNVTYQLKLQPALSKSVPSAKPVSRAGTPGMSPGFYRRYAKRVLDVVLVVIAAPAVLSVVLLLALMILMVDRRNPFYWQDRLGMQGRVFRMMKLRTMVPDADRIFDAYLAANPAARAEWERDQKLRNDPRVTWLGDILRRSSLDELPQLWNVLRGDMSLVGPRPMMVSQRDLYPGSEYYLLRPGITGYWQTSVRNMSSFAERANFDRQYHTDLSLKTDVLLLVRTLKVVAQGTGC
jgi:lipopolysaccharide/colanic/teichoic acid biosynthesis glycosyltransferase